MYVGNVNRSIRIKDLKAPTACCESVRSVNAGVVLDEELGCLVIWCLEILLELIGLGWTIE